jgi:hypothetical protein
MIGMSAGTSAAQSPSYGFRDNSRARGDTVHAAANNPWYRLGAQFGYKVAGNDDFADALIASSRIVLQQLAFPSQSPRVGLPVIGNLSKLNASLSEDSVGSLVQKLMSTAEGMNVGLYPYVEMFDPSVNKSTQLTFYGSAVWKLNAGRDRTDSASFAFHQGRFSAGADLNLLIAQGSELPVSLSGEIAVTTFRAQDYHRVTGRSRSKLTSLELTGILPVRSDLGLLGQVALPLSDIPEDKSLFRVGFMYVPKGQGDENPAPETDGVVPPPAPETSMQVALSGTVVDPAKAPVGSANVTFVGVYPGGALVGGRCPGAKINESGQSAFTAEADGTFEIQTRVKGKAGDQVCVGLAATDPATGRTGTLFTPVKLTEPSAGMPAAVSIGTPVVVPAS